MSETETTAEQYDFVRVHTCEAIEWGQKDQYRAECGYGRCGWRGIWTPNRATAEKQVEKHQARHAANR